MLLYSAGILTKLIYAKMVKSCHILCTMRNTGEEKKKHMDSQQEQVAKLAKKVLLANIPAIWYIHVQIKYLI